MLGSDGAGGGGRQHADAADVVVRRGSDSCVATSTSECEQFASRELSRRFAEPGVEAFERGEVLCDRVPGDVVVASRRTSCPSVANIGRTGLSVLRSAKGGEAELLTEAGERGGPLGGRGFLRQFVECGGE